MQLKKRIGAFVLAVTVITSQSAGNMSAMERNDNESMDIYTDSFENSATEEQYKCSGGTFQIKDGILTINGDGVVGLQDYLWYNATYEFDIDVSGKSNDDWAGVQFDK